MSLVASRELRNDTAGVLRRVAAGEDLDRLAGHDTEDLGPIR